jgi:hypothetical protein
VGQRDTDLDARFAERARDVRAELDRLLGEARRRYRQSQPRRLFGRPALMTAAVAVAFVAGAAFALLQTRSPRRRRLGTQVGRLRGVPAAVSRALAS